MYLGVTSKDIHTITSQTVLHCGWRQQIERNTQLVAKTEEQTSTDRISWKMDLKSKQLLTWSVNYPRFMKLKARYRIHKTPPLSNTDSQLNPQPH
jgi:hypothetical protein